jgi:4-diphosphocytidyl-2C-methyl-D-erythritol kinase
MFARLDAAPFDWREFPRGDELYNDFERVAPCESLELIDRLLAHGARDAGLTGSGSATFGRFRDEASARFAAGRIADESGAGAWAVPTLTRAQCLVTNAW